MVISDVAALRIPVARAGGETSSDEVSADSGSVVAALPVVLVIASDPVVRAAWVTSLQAIRAAQKIDEASTSNEARLRSETYRSTDLTILAADLGQPGGLVRTLDLISVLRRSGCGRLVVAAAWVDAESVRVVLHAGVRACLFPPALAAAAATSEHPSVNGPGLLGRAPRGAVGVTDVDGVERELSHRELQVLQCAADGQPNREIGATLSVSALTVKSHLSRIARKLGTGDRSRMVFLALRAGAIS